MFSPRLLASSRPVLRARASVGPRFASTAPPPVTSRIRSALYSTALVLGTGAFVVYIFDSRAGIHRVFLPALALLTADDPEKAHEIAVKVIGSALVPVDRGVDDERLALEVWGKKFSNPLGMAAGFDKHGEAIDGLFGLGFGYVEIGSVTPEPQAGNPKPRVFRVAETQSLINRYGFNSEGHTTVMSRLRHRIRQFVARNSLTIPADLFPAPPAYALPDHDVVAQLLASSAGKDALVTDAIALPRSLVPGHVLAINLGKNKTSDPDSISDFVDGVHALGPYADVLVINVSSPNTPGLRNLQRKGMLEELLVGVIAARDSLPGLSNKIPVLVKVAPDLSASELEDIASAVMSAKIDGIVVSNTTISRPASAGESPNLAQAGGLSGPPVKPLALAALSALHTATDGSIPLIGCGGISTGQDAIDFAKAGATLVQLYTSFIYGGVGLPRRIKDEVAEILEKEGKTWTQMVGSGLKKVVRVVEAADNKEVFVPFTPDELVAELKSATHELETVFGDLSPAIPAVVSESPIIDHHHDEPDFCVGSQIEEEGGFCVAPPRKTPAAASTPAPVVESTISPITSDPIDHAKIELLDAAAVNALLAFEPVTPVVVVVVEPVVEAVPSSPQP